MTIRDGLVFGGIACVALGAGCFHVGAGLIVFGAALAALGLAGVFRRSP